MPNFINFVIFQFWLFFYFFILRIVSISPRDLDPVIPSRRKLDDANSECVEVSLGWNGMPFSLVIFLLEIRKRRGFPQIKMSNQDL